MPNQPKTPARAVRIDDALWDAVKQEAARRGETATDVVRRALREHLRLSPEVAPVNDRPQRESVVVAAFWWLLAHAAILFFTLMFMLPIMALIVGVAPEGVWRTAAWVVAVDLYLYVAWRMLRRKRHF